MNTAGLTAMSATSRLILDPLDKDAWRLRDLAVDPADAASVVAYVERPRKGRYEVTWLSDGPTTEIVPNPDVLFRRAEEMLRGGEVVH
ncbi:hypothetical protein ACQ143_05175 [Microbacterium sp. MC2]